MSFMGWVDWMIERDIIMKETDDYTMENKEPESYAMTLNNLAKVTHEANFKWWINPLTGAPIQRNTGELLMLVTSELVEALEGDRKGLMDDKLLHRKMFDVEIVDALIRLFDIAGARGINLDAIYWEKMKYNQQREDHKHENRLKAGGKKY